MTISLTVPLAVELAMLVLPCSTAAQTSRPQADRARALTEGQVDTRHSIELAAPEFVLAPDLGWVGIERPGRGVVARELETGRELTPPGEARCVAFRPGRREAWFGLAEGGIWVAPLEEDAQGAPLALAVAGAIDHLEFASHGDALAWRCAATDELSVAVAIGVLSELRVQQHWTCTAHFTACRSTTFGRATRAPFAFTPDGRRFVYTAGADTRATRDAGALEAGHLWDLQEARELATFRPYLTHAARGFVLAANDVVYARRDGASDWSIRSLDSRAPEREVIVDEDARGGHFIDLFIDARGRWLVEADFEEERPRVYDLRGEHPPRLLGSARTSFAGFDATTDPARPLALLAARRSNGLVACSVDGSGDVAELGAVGRSLEEGGRVMRAEPTADGRWLVVSATLPASEQRVSRYGLRVLSLDGH